MTTYLRSLIIVVVVALAVAACGDDDLGSDLGGNTSADVPGFGDDGFGDDGFGDGDATLPTSVGNIPGLSSECEAYLNLSLAMSAAFTGEFSGFDGDLVSRLPAAAQADGAIIVAALQEFSDELAAAGLDLSQGLATFSQEQIQAFGDLSEEIFNDEVDAAFDRLSEAGAAECAIGGDF